MQCVLSLVFEFLLLGDFVWYLVSRFFLAAQPKDQQLLFVDWYTGGGVIEDFQHRIDISQGQEERIPETYTL